MTPADAQRYKPEELKLLTSQASIAIHIFMSLHRILHTLQVTDT